MTWQKIPDWPYEVSDIGQIRRNGRILKQTVKNGYSMILLTDGIRRRYTGIHRLMLIAFSSPPVGAQQSRHLNGNSRDNRLCNLAWGTPQENISDRDRHGTTARGSKNGGAKLSEAQVVEIRRLYDAHLQCRLSNGFQRARRGFCCSLAHDYGVTQSSINRVVTRSSW